MKSGRRKFWLILAAALFLLIVGYQIVGRIYLEENKQIRTRIRESVEQRYPELADEMRAMYGMKSAGGQVFEDSKGAGIHDVILIHGMDDPGKVWMNLSPMLTSEGFHVWIMSYPDDQPVSESARFFFEEMTALRRKRIAAVSIVSIVAHSMGGLVAREMLGNPELSYARAALEGRVPTVSSLIMVGTPNHGSELAQFRIFGEFRDQLSDLLKGNYIWLQGILDGAGEAGMDLVPGSPFLEELNSRPPPENVTMAVIAGVMTDWAKSDVEQFVGMMTRRLPGNTHNAIAGIGDLLNSMGNGLGDGVVSVNSAKLNGCPLHIVQGNHLSIIRNIRESSKKIPPAVPIIMEYLKKGSAPVGKNKGNGEAER